MTSLRVPSTLAIHAPMCGASGDKAGAIVGVAQQIVPKGEPVVRVALIAGEQVGDYLGALVRRRIRQKSSQLLRRRRKPRVNRLKPLAWH